MSTRIPKPASVLIIGDDADFIEANRLVLGELGYRLSGAASASEAESVLADGAFDVIVLDVMMESPTAGFELAGRIRRLAPAPPVLMVSGIRNAVGRQLRFEPDDKLLPVAKFLDKPIAPTALAAEIDAALRASTTSECEHGKDDSAR